MPEVRDANEYQRQGRRTWTTDSHPSLTRGWELIRDIEKAADLLDSSLDQHKRALFYGDDTAKVLRGPAGRDHILEGISDEEWELIHAVLGIATEAGEILDQLLSLFAGGRELDVQNLREEGGDVAYYLARLADVTGTTLLAMMQANHRKLAERFPEKFTQQGALVRDTDAEMAALDNDEFEGEPMWAQ